MALYKSEKSHLVYYVVYEYDDNELNNHMKFTNYFQSLLDLSQFIEQLYSEFEMLENSFYHCRSNFKMKVSMKSISDKLFVSLFNQNAL